MTRPTIVITSTLPDPSPPPERVIYYPTARPGVWYAGWMEQGGRDRDRDVLDYVGRWLDRLDAAGPAGSD
jgi:hypothetical protein